MIYGRWLIEGAPRVLLFDTGSCYDRRVSLLPHLHLFHGPPPPAPARSTMLAHPGPLKPFIACTSITHHDRPPPSSCTSYTIHLLERLPTPLSTASVTPAHRERYADDPRMNEWKTDLWNLAGIPSPPNDHETNEAIVFGYIVAWFLGEVRPVSLY